MYQIHTRSMSVVPNDERVWGQKLKSFLYVFFRKNTCKLYGPYGGWYTRTESLVGGTHTQNDWKEGNGVTLALGPSVNSRRLMFGKGGQRPTARIQPPTRSKGGETLVRSNGTVWWNAGLCLGSRRRTSKGMLCLDPGRQAGDGVVCITNQNGVD